MNRRRQGWKVDVLQSTHDEDLPPPSGSVLGNASEVETLPSHKKNTLSFEESKPPQDSGFTHKRATSDFALNPRVGRQLGEEGTVQSPQMRIKHPVGSVYHHANAISPNCASVSSTNSSSLVSGSVEVIVSELENPAESDQLEAQQSLKNLEDSDMSETEQIIRNIIKQRSRGEKSLVAQKEKPLDLHDCISTIITQRKAESRKLEDQRWQLKQHILEVITQAPSDGRTQNGKDAGRKSSMERQTGPVGASFHGDLIESEESVPEFNEYVSEVKVTPYQRSLSTEKKIEASYSKEISFREKSPRPLRSPPIDLEEAKDSSKRQTSFQPSNRKIIKNAICTVCLSGDSNRRLRDQVLDLINQRSSTSIFVIAFKGTLGRQDFAALYEHDLANGVLKKLMGPTLFPAHVTPAQVHASYRYDSTAREFKPMPQKRLSLGTDAVSIMLRKG